MNSSVSSIYYSPVKSLSFESVNLCMVKKKLGIQKGDRVTKGQILKNLN